MTMRLSQFHSQMLLLKTILLLAAALNDRFSVAAAAEHQPPIGRPNCRDRCGNISIPYPFGIGPGCFLAHQFEVYCNDSTSPPGAFLAFNPEFVGQENYELITNISNGEAVQSFGPEKSPSRSPIELVDISVAKNEARAYGAVASYCTKSPAEQILKAQVTTIGLSAGDVELDGVPFSFQWPFSLSTKRNSLVVVGMNAEAMLENGVSFSGTSCTSFGSDDSFLPPTNGSCAGSGCCQISLAGNKHINELRMFEVKFTPTNSSSDWVRCPCSYGMVVESSWYNFSTPDMYGYEVLSKKLQRGVPFVIDFSIMSGENGTCQPAGQQPPRGYTCASGNSFCTNTSTRPSIQIGSYPMVENPSNYICKCNKYYEGNPYITNGCQDIDECKRPDMYPCSTNGVCKNRLEGYDCPCKPGMKGDGKAGSCKHTFPAVARVIAGAIGVLLLAVILSVFIILQKKKRKMREFYVKNSGPTLEKVKLIKLIKKEDLKPILKSSNFIGKGGFGEVYKCCLGDEIVAVRKPISGSTLEDELFANEVIIQSQVNHKNIVRLIGCCLEVDIPMLVYEFLSKGSLEDILHSDNKVPFNLDLRLRIAAGSADGLSFMHSKTPTAILHGHIKPANILLDDKFVPKISDFGISRLIQRDKQHIQSTIGDRSYMDPIYLQTGIVTEQSDVYSFGAVILELITREKATYSNNLVKNFLEVHRENKKATEYFDKEIAVTRDLELLDSLAELAVECLGLVVDQRLTMTEVAERLRKLSRSRGL